MRYSLKFVFLLTCFIALILAALAWYDRQVARKRAKLDHLLAIGCNLVLTWNGPSWWPHESDSVEISHAGGVDQGLSLAWYDVAEVSGFHLLLTDHDFAVIGEYQTIEKIDFTWPDPTGVLHYAYKGRPTFTARGLSALTGLRHLRELSLDEVSLAPGWGESIGRLTELKVLSVSGFHKDCFLSERDLSEIAKLPRLEELEFVDVYLESAGPFGQAGWPALKKLSLQISNIRDGDLADIGSLSTVEELRLSDYEPYGNGLHHLANLRQLRLLDLSCSDIDANGLAGLAGMPALRELNLNNAKINGTWPKVLAALPELTTLDVSDTEFDDDAMEDVPGCKCLRELDLSRTRVTAAGLQKLVGMRSLQQVTISATAIGSNTDPSAISTIKIHNWE